MTEADAKQFIDLYNEIANSTDDKNKRANAYKKIGQYYELLKQKQDIKRHLRKHSISNIKLQLNKENKRENYLKTHNLNFHKLYIFTKNNHEWRNFAILFIALGAVFLLACIKSLGGSAGALTVAILFLGLIVAESFICLLYHVEESK